jgi:hydroxymethylpyrimidine pyrophosphatase-like HAD family hydrolase
MIVRVAIATGRPFDEVRHYHPALLATIIEELRASDG